MLRLYSLKFIIYAFKNAFLNAMLDLEHIFIFKQEATGLADGFLLILMVLIR